MTQQIKPKPTNVPDTHTVARCGKCGGSGIYAMEVHNGIPWSATGTTCWGCNGRGWKLRRKPAKRTKPVVDDTPAPVEVKPAPEAPTTAIVYSDLVRNQPFSHVHYSGMQGWSANAKYCGECGREMTLRGSQERGCCGKCYSVWYAQDAIVRAKPAATTSPALVETGERVIALPAQFRVIGNQTYRITRHGKVISVETLNPLCGAYEHEGNYINDFQVGNFLNRKRREWRADHPKSAPAITVKPAAPETYTVNRGNSVFRVTRDEGMGGRWLVEQWKSPRGTAEWFSILPCATEEQVDGLIGVVVTPPVYTRETLVIASAPKADAPTPIQVDPRLTPQLIEDLKTLSHLPRTAHLVNRKKPTSKPVIGDRRVDGLVAMGYARKLPRDGVAITEAGRTALQATFKSSAVNSKTGGVE